MTRPIKYRILDAGAAFFGLLDWQAEPFYYATSGWVRSLCLLPAMRRREPPARPGVATATPSELDAIAVLLKLARRIGEPDSEFRERIKCEARR